MPIRSLQLPLAALPFSLLAATLLAATLLAATTASAQCDPVPYTPGSTVQGELSPGDCRIVDLGLDDDDETLVDAYFFTLDETSLFQVNLDSTEFDAFAGVVVLPSLNVLTADNDSGQGSNAFIRGVVLKPGAYLVLANSFELGGTGSYQLTTQIEPFAPTCETTEDIVSGEDRVGALGPEDCVVLGSYADFYRITLPEASLLTVSHTSDEVEGVSEIDALLLLRPENGAVIADDDDGGEGTNSLFFRLPLQAGTYIVIASSFDADEVGGYTLSVDVEDALPGCEPEPITPQEVIEGTLEAPDCTIEQLGIDSLDQSFVDLYEFTLSEPGHRRISLESTDFDAYLWLFEKPASESTLVRFIGIPPIAEDDDGGEGFDSLISDVDLQAGTYILLANSIDNGESGAYTLTLPEPSPTWGGLAALLVFGARLRRRRAVRRTR